MFGLTSKYSASAPSHAERLAILSRHEQIAHNSFYLFPRRKLFKLSFVYFASFFFCFVFLAWQTADAASEIYILIVSRPSQTALRDLSWWDTRIFTLSCFEFFLEMQFSMIMIFQKYTNTRWRVSMSPYKNERGRICRIRKLEKNWYFRGAEICEQ